jgi:choline dehydrogenase
MQTTSRIFDYIVVGAGSAGCVVARRLSDDSSLRVLLLEAGPPSDDFWIRTPAGMGKMFRSEQYNWRFSTEPVPGLRDRRIYWPRGKTLGGTSAINGMVYIRGNRRDYDHWAQLGNAGWSWAEVLPYFIKSERNTRGAGPFHGADGPMEVADQIAHPATTAFLQAAQRFGLPFLEDLNTGEPEGAGYLQATIRKGVRQSSFEAFLAPVRSRPNLTIRTGAHVRRVLVAGREATGVELEENGAIHSVAATREVVVCGGALNSPHLLMLSGIGDSEMLRRHGIEPRLYLPGVGRNLQDHFSVRVQAETDRASSYNLDLRGWRKYWQGARYLATRGGYLALASTAAAAYVRSSPQVEYPDIQLSFRPMTFTARDSGVVDVDPYHAVSASVYRVRPASRGEVSLRSADPMAAPFFMPNYMSAPEDIEAMLSGLRQLRRIFALEPLASRIVKEIAPGTGVDSDEQLLDFMQREGQCAFHPVGTCKMGRDAMAVVDERLRVRGIERLRVVDASIMPTVISGNTNAPAIMIGEKGADMIRADQASSRTADAVAAPAPNLRQASAVL